MCKNRSEIFQHTDSNTNLRPRHDTIIESLGRMPISIAYLISEYDHFHFPDYMAFPIFNVGIYITYIVTISETNFAVATNDGIIQIYYLNQFRHKFKGHNKPLQFLKVFKNRTVLVSCTDKIINLFNVDGSRLCNDIKIEEPVLDIKILPNNNELLILTKKNKFHISETVIDV